MNNVVIIKKLLISCELLTHICWEIWFMRTLQMSPQFPCQKTSVRTKCKNSNVVLKNGNRSISAMGPTRSHLNESRCVRNVLAHAPKS